LLIIAPSAGKVQRKQGMKKNDGNKMLSQRVKYAQAHLSRKEHIALLARPNWRRLRRTDPNVLVYTSIFIIIFLRLFGIKRTSFGILLFPVRIRKRLEIRFPIVSSHLASASAALGLH